MSDWFDAAEAGDEAKMANLLSSGLVADVDEIQDGQTALFVGAGLAHPSVVRFLLSNGADPSSVDGDGCTVLMAAAHGGSEEVIQLLLAARVDTTTRDNDGKTAFDYAKLARKKGALSELLDAGATPGREKIVLVLGAGFTKAFLPAAPLLLDNYGMEGTLTRKYRELEYANDILQDELARARPFGAGKVDLERLMTRLDGGMPYDESHSAVNQLQYWPHEKEGYRDAGCYTGGGYVAGAAHLLAMILRSGDCDPDAAALISRQVLLNGNSAFFAKPDIPTYLIGTPHALKRFQQIIPAPNETYTQLFWPQNTDTIDTFIQERRKAQRTAISAAKEAKSLRL